jgi:hypothetical protein
MKNHPSNIYSIVDFDDETEFKDFFAIERNNTLTTIQHIAKYFVFFILI